MNNDIVNEKELILLYGLRTARQRKRAQRESFEKKLRALGRERVELRRKKNNLGWVELDPPVMRGWKRFFVLRDDVAESIYATFFQNILDKINTTTFSNRKDFKVKKKRQRRWKYNIKKHELLAPFAWQFNKLGFSEIERSFFEERTVMNYHRVWVTMYVFKEPWRFVLKVRPNMITRTRIRDVEMESRYSEIMNYFENRALDSKLSRLQGCSSHCRGWKEWEKEDEKYEFKNRAFTQILDKLKEEI